METTRKIKIGLLGKIVIAIAAGIITGLFFPEWIVRIFITFNGIFGEFLGFAIPLIILPNRCSKSRLQSRTSLIPTTEL